MRVPVTCHRQVAPGTAWSNQSRLEITESKNRPSGVLDLRHAETTSNITTSGTSSSNPAATVSFHFIHCHMQNATILCRSRQLLPSVCAVYSFPPPSSTNYSPTLPHYVFPSISRSTCQPFCFQIHTYNILGNSVPFHSLFMSKPTKSIYPYSLYYSRLLNHCTNFYWLTFRNLASYI